MLISQISRKIYEDHGISISARELNAMLIKTGDLVETGIGKVETKLGRSHGIRGEYRDYDDSSYWCPLYDEKSIEYVTDLALQVFADRLNDIERRIEELAEKAEKLLISASEENSNAKPIQINHCCAPTASCKNCMSYISEECLIPKPHPCTDYRAAYVPTESEIEAQINAGENTVTAKNLNQNALGMDKSK